MNHIGLLNRIIYNKRVYNVYYKVGNIVVAILKRFVKQDDKLCLFVTYGGRSFGDSPRAIYDRMCLDQRFNDYKFVWAFVNPDSFQIERGVKIKIDTLSYFITALKARLWVTNSAIERGLSFKGKHTFYFNTWHGTPIKKMGIDIDSQNESFKSSSNNKADVQTAQSRYEADIFGRVFGIPYSKLKIIGLPRNDELILRQTCNVREEVRKKLGISSDKKIILYAPTFREYSRDTSQNCIMTPPLDLSKWKKELCQDYILLFRAHYEIVKVMNIVNDDFCKDVSDYPSLNELMIVSDLLISDYSSVFFDYSIQNKPMITFCYDYDDYARERGMYFDIREELKSDNKDEDQLITTIKNLVFDESINITKSFRDKYVTEYGNACSQSLEIIYENISN